MLPYLLLIQYAFLVYTLTFVYHWRLFPALGILTQGFQACDWTQTSTIIIREYCI